MCRGEFREWNQWVGCFGKRKGLDRIVRAGGRERLAGSWAERGADHLAGCDDWGTDGCGSGERGIAEFAEGCASGGESVQGGEDN